MLIKLSNQTYINPDKITCITERPHYGEAQAYWVVTFDGENNLVLSQAHFDELMACLPSPVEASKIQADTEVITNIHGQTVGITRTAGGYTGRLIDAKD